ncbi:hypothetical protein [Anoxybacterium hadale]|uniref:hypothetical protein n=1 Tax=Anoxybacterium hadale TaxID=3408580 RepID=UPI003AFFE7A7
MVKNRKETPMVSLHFYRLLFYFTVIWLVAGIIFVCCSMIRYFVKKRLVGGGPKHQ